MIVKLEGQVNEAFPNVNGTYIKIDKMHGKEEQHWIQENGDNAIWYNSSQSDWYIGQKFDREKSFINSRYSENFEDGPENSREWLYRSESDGWKSTIDIKVFGM